jgi:hypothetical protein
MVDLHVREIFVLEVLVSTLSLAGWYFMKNDGKILSVSILGSL